MLQQVEKKIEEFKKAQAKEYYRKKDSDLEAWGLASKKEGNKTIPIIVTNDEYEALIKAANGAGDASRNKVSGVLNTAAIAVVAAGLVGAVALFNISSAGMLYASLAIALSIVFALIMKGLAEAIKLLQQIIDTRPLETPEISEEELKSEANKKKNKQEAPVQYDMNQYPAYPPQYMPQQPMAPAQQPPIHQAPGQQPQAVQAYPFSPVAPMADSMSEIEIENAYVPAQGASSAPQQF